MKKFYKKSLAVLAGLVLAAQMLIPSAGIFGSNEAYADDPLPVCASISDLVNLAENTNSVKSVDSTEYIVTLNSSADKKMITDDINSKSSDITSLLSGVQSLTVGGTSVSSTNYTDAVDAIVAAINNPTGINVTVAYESTCNSEGLPKSANVKLVKLPACKSTDLINSLVTLAGSFTNSVYGVDTTSGYKVTFKGDVTEEKINTDITNNKDEIKNILSGDLKGLEVDGESVSVSNYSSAVSKIFNGIGGSVTVDVEYDETKCDPKGLTTRYSIALDTKLPQCDNVISSLIAKGKEFSTVSDITGTGADYTLTFKSSVSKEALSGDVVAKKDDVKSILQAGFVTALSIDGVSVVSPNLDNVVSKIYDSIGSTVTVNVTFDTTKCFSKTPNYKVKLEKETEKSSSSSNGGGSSSSHKCNKSTLPANATANNTTKPKKNTDYTYSTNTGDVCTFQCNKDYTWNATTSKCEAESTTTTGDNNEVKQEETPVEVTVSEEAQETYGDEMIDAYRWAAQKGITTILDADAANLASPITRAQLAKMMSVYAVKVLGRDLIVKDDVSYDDVDSSLGDLEGYIKLAYQLQIMGINADGTPLKNFNPNREVSRGEFVTVFSRVLFGNKFNQDGTEYYAKHMANLKELEILSVDDPDMQELRGWVILMLYRSQDNEGVTAIQEAIADEANAKTPAEEETPAAEEAAPAEKATEETK